MTAARLYRDPTIKVEGFEMIPGLVGYAGDFYQDCVKKMLVLFQKIHEVIDNVKNGQDEEFLSFWKNKIKTFNVIVRKVEGELNSLFIFQKARELIELSIRFLFFSSCIHDCSRSFFLLLGSRPGWKPCIRTILCHSQWPPLLRTVKDLISLTRSFFRGGEVSWVPLPQKTQDPSWRSMT